MVERVPLAVLIERFALEVLPGRPAAFVGVSATRVLVDVVAEEHEGVDVPFFDQVAVGGVPALLPVLARREGEPETIGQCPRCGEGVRPSGWSRVLAESEAVVVLLVGVEAGGIHVHRVSEGCDRGRGAVDDDLGEVLVAGDLPCHLDVGVGQRFRRLQTRPEDHRVGQSGHPTRRPA